jgi:hypothetical protein
MKLMRKHILVKFLEEEEAMLPTADCLQFQIMKKAKRPRKKTSAWRRGWEHHSVLWTECVAGSRSWRRCEGLQKLYEDIP